MGRESQPHDGLFSTQLPHDRGTVPAGVEDSSEAAWREYDACCEALDHRLGRLRAGAALHARQAIRKAATGRAIEASLHLDLQAPPVPSQPAPVLPHPGSPATLEEVLRLARSQGRICPRPVPWRSLFLLISRRRETHAPPPVDERDWDQTPDLVKQRMLRDQIEWAQRHGVLHRMRDGLSALAERDWHHLPVLAWPTLAIIP